MQRYRITTTTPGGVEQTWVLLPDMESARMQAQEHHQREKTLHVRIYHEVTGAERDLVLDLPPKA